MSKTFISFSDDKGHFREALERIINQANYLNIFDNIIGYNDEDLKNDINFWPIHGNFVLNNHRGYGHWLWKPYLIMKTLEKMNDNDLILYCDCGCELDSYRKNEILEVFSFAERDLIVGSFTDHNEICFNKIDLLVYLDMNHENIWYSTQNQATALCIKKCQKTYDLIKEWYELCCNYHFIDDSNSHMQKHDCFQDHRHDQGVFSLLTKKYKLFSNHSLNDAVYLSRNRCGISRINLPDGCWINSCSNARIFKNTLYADLRRADGTLNASETDAYLNNSYMNIDGNFRSNKTMNLLTDKTNYIETIKLAINLNEKYDKSVIFHCYWNGILNEKHLYSIMSCYYFNVYKNKHQIILWLDNNIPNEFNSMIEKYAQIKYFSLNEETPGFFPKNINFSKELHLYSHVVRYIILYNYGGIWFDIDCLFLRNFDPLFFNFGKEICVYQWECLQNPNGAILISLEKKSIKLEKIIKYIIRRERGWGFREASLNYDLPIDFFVLPCSWFDPSWIENPYFIDFNNFFEDTDIEYNFNNFFKGSFCYHWHNQWDKKIANNSIIKQLIFIIEQKLMN